MYFNEEGKHSELSWIDQLEDFNSWLKYKQKLIMNSQKSKDVDLRTATGINALTERYPTFKEEFKAYQTEKKFLTGWNKNA